ncbi:MAG TPA: DUF3857 domain-containing protein, partial [Longimicrobium sp.]|nr:DUF3857 domain-containing protein [Longimicrobium sp.]
MAAWKRMTCLLLLAAPLVAVAATPADPTVELAQSYAQQALDESKSPRGAAALLRLHALRDDLEDLAVLGNTYVQLVADRRADPFVRTTARMLLMDVEKARGRMTKATELSQELGYVHDFYVAGGFDNEGKAGCANDFGPEAAALDLKASYPAKGREVSWRKVRLAPLDGYVDLSTVVRPNKEAVAYAVTFLDAPRDTDAQLAFGTSGGHRLWVNGQLASTSDRYNHPRPDQERVQVRLKKGLNRVLLKVCQESGPLGFYLRQEPGSVQVQATLPETAPALPKGATQVKALPTLTGVLQAEVEKKPEDALLRAAFAIVLHHFRAYEDREHTATVQAESAAELAPGNVRLLLLAAELQDDDANLRRKHLEAAVKAAPQDPHARLALANHEMNRGHPERVLPLLEETLKERPAFLGAKLALAQAYQALGEWPRAAQLVEAALREHPRVPAAARDAAMVSRRFERFPEAIERYRTRLALRFDDSNSRRALANILADLRDVAGAGTELERLLQQDPFDNGSRLRLAELYAANGKEKEADRLFAEAKALSADEPDVFEREGRALLLQARRDEAIASFERALVLRPQNPALKEALRALKGENTSYGTQYALDVKALSAEADSYAGEDAVYLADYTYARVQPSGLSSRFQQIAVKVYTQRGVDAFRQHSITYSPDRQEVRILRARILKPDGSVVESFGEQDRAINEPWSGMYYDSRAKVLSFPQLAPGDLLEMQYRLEDTAQDNLLSDYWGDVDYVQGTMPKVRYQFIVDMPSSRPLYWNKSGMPPGVSTAKEEKDGRVVYRWNAKNVAKVVPEPSMPGWAEVASVLHVSTYQTWEQVGRYYWGLVRDQLTPNDDLRKTTERVLKGVDRKDERAVVSAIYNFVVSNTRYVALEFGIHGYKPYRVDRILARRFGDCKDKASLIHAMLKVAGVDSKLVLLRMRHLGSLAEEPASLAAFNHAIAYVPSQDLWLDGTAEFHGAKELPSSDRAANVLVVEPDGGSRFYATPEALAEHNVTRLAMDVTVKPDGSSEVKGRTTVIGQSAPEYRRAYQSAATRKATFEQAWGQTFPGLTVQEVSLSDPLKLDDDVTLDFRMGVPRYAEVLQTGLRFHPFGAGRAYTESFAPLTERRFDLVLQGPWTNQFSFRYTLPPGYAVRELPRDISEESPF